MSKARQPQSAVAVLGAGGHAKVVIAALEAAGEAVAGVFDDDEATWGQSLLGHVVEGPLALLARKGLRRAVLAIGSNDVRRRLSDLLDQEWVSVVHPRAWVHQGVAIGAGATVMAGAIVQPGSFIGRHAIINTSASVDHDCRIGDFVHIAPGARLAGGVTVGEGAHVGIGSSVIEGVEIGAGAFVAAGAVVVDSVAPRIRVAGIPARPFDRT